MSPVLTSLKDWPSRLLVLAFAGFIAAQFVISRDKTWDFFFYLAVIPALIYYAFSHARTVSTALCSRSVALIFALLAWLCLSVAWQPDGDWFDAFQYLRRSFLVSLFIIGGLLFFSRIDDAVERIFWSALIALASLCAIISLALFLGGWQGDAIRLEAIGQLEQPILGAAVYGVFGLKALHFTVTQPRHRLIYLGAFAIIALLTYFTYSRGQLLAFGISCLAMGMMLLSAKWQRGLLLLMGLGAFGIALIALIPSLREGIMVLPEAQMLLRDSHRLGIWQQAIATIAERPLFGWGAASVFSAQIGGITAPHTHNLLLGTLFQGGLVAGAVLIAMLVTLAKRAHGFGAILLLFMLLSTLTDNPYLVDSPAPFWTFFWLPVCYIITRHIGEKPSC